MKSFRFLLMAGLIALGFGACSDEVDVPKGGEELSGDVYMSFDLKLPTSRSETDENDGQTNSNANPDYEVGHNYENAVSNIKVVLATLENGKYTMDDVREMIQFLHNTLNVRNSETKNLEDCELVLYIKNKLNRPIRVCGMVKNDGEPGGGPYIAYNQDGSRSPQILESAQFDMSKPESAELIKSGTHFNPVDLVCYIKDYKGNKFNLKKYVDKQTGLISEKSKSGTTIKALELPGLWNGSMSDWNTIFVDVPLATFNPVKTVNDLLRVQHQG